MKVALYVDEGRNQIVLNPESDFEKGMLKRLCETMKNREGAGIAVEMGGFYACRGGWNRHSLEQQSLMIVLDSPDA